MPDDAPSKPYEVPLTVLVAAAATLAGIAGFLAAKEQNVENDHRASGLSKLTEANTLYLDAAGNLARDGAVFLQVQVLDDEGRHALASELINQTQLVTGGYFDADLTPAEEFGDDADAAFEAYEDDMYAPSAERRLEADADFARSETASGKGLDFLFSTVILAVGTLLGTVAMSAAAKPLRLGMTAALALAFVGAATLILVTVSA